MTNVLANIARVVSATTGTGTLTLGAAVQGFNTFADAGITDGQTVTYAIEDYTAGVVSAREVGEGVYNTAGPTLTRATVYSSTSAGAKINCSGSQQVFITVSKEDINSLGGGSLSDGDYGDIVVSGSGTVLSIDTSVATTFGRSLMDDADATAGRATLGLGTMATETASNYLTTAAAASGYQPLDAELSAIASLTSAADRLPYYTGSGTAALATFTTAGRNLLDDADTTAQRTTLGLGTAATQNTGTSGATIPFLNGGNVWSGTNNFGTGTGTGATVNIFNDVDFSAPLGLASAQGSSNPGPNFLFRRVSPSPVSGDYGGSLLFQGYDNTNTVQSYQQMLVRFLDIIPASLSGEMQLFGWYAGGFALRHVWGGGYYASGATGGDKGTGTVNAVTLYENGTSLAAKYQPLDADLTAIAGLAAPGADRLLFWDHSALTWTHLTLGTNLSITGTTLNASGGGGGASATYGTATLNFGSVPGTNIVTTTITGQTGILSGSTISAWLMAEATATHNAYEHMIVPLRITCGNIVAGVGFDIVAVSDLRLTGTFTCRWEGNY
jgi:hypothetical protein